MKSLSLLVLAALASSAPALVLAQAPAAPPAPPAASGAATADTEHQLEAARQRLEADAREVAELSARLGEDAGQRFMRRGMMMPRAVLGVQIDAKPGAGGASVVAVSPGGAAAAAGIEAGDTITAIDGEDLAKAAEPARALVERMRELKPDTKVKLKVLHAGKARDLEVVARAPEPGMFAMPAMSGMPGMPGMHGTHGMPEQAAMPGHDGMMRHFELRRDEEGPPMPPGMQELMAAHHHLDGLELATLSPRLGGYFGAKTGVLVVRAGGGFKLEDGDVITAIDGREPTSAAQATRILMSYGRGEKALIKVLRDRKAVQLDAVIGAK